MNLTGEWDDKKPKMQLKYLKNDSTQYIVDGRYTSMFIVGLSFAAGSFAGII